MGKKICAKTVHLSHEDNELLEAIAHASGTSCSEVIHDALQPVLEQQKKLFLSMAQAMGFSRSSGRSEPAERADESPSARFCRHDDYRPERLH